MMSDMLLIVENVKKDYLLPKTHIFQPAPIFRALHGVSLKIPKGTNFGIVGESGCGKSTLARIVMGLDTPTGGTVYFQNQDIFRMSAKKLRHLRSQFQMVFQDPHGSLNPRHNVLRIVSEPLDTLAEKLSLSEKKGRVRTLLREVGLNDGDLDKFPHEFSGGQRQRIGIARALITRPFLIVADEAVSALDVSVQAQVLNLMMALQEKYQLTYMFISHDLSVVEYLCDETAVLYSGRIVEMGKTRNIFQNPNHPYTRLLLEAVPIPDPLHKKKKILPMPVQGEDENTGCPFKTRCSLATEICSQSMPKLLLKGRQQVACHHA